jgi:predicted Zn finger-like uncharacterized protein
MNADELFTRCPTCKTVYRTHEEQLSVQAGKVRCGQCRMVFDGRAHLVDLTPKQELPPDDGEMGPPTATLQTSVDRSPADEEPALASSAASIAPTEVATEKEIAPSSEEELVMPVWKDSPPPPRRGTQWAYAMLAVVLLATLAGQAIFHFRHFLAADYPQLRPHLVAACAAIGCTVDPPRNKVEITIESHDLQADPAHQGLLILQTTLRNQARHPLAFPHLELELNDLGGQPIVRRVFAPVEYAGGAADFTNGMPANAEWNVKIFLDASSVSAGGYNLYLFYP